MSKILITMLAITTIATAEPYFSSLPARSLYGSLFPSSYASTVVQQAVPLVQEPVPAVVPGVPAVQTVVPAAGPATLPLSAAYTNPELANYAYGDYSSLYGLSNYAPLASSYSVSPYSYAFSNYFYKR